MILPITKGNVVKSFIIGLVALTVGLYFVTGLAGFFTLAAKDVYAATGDPTVNIPEMCIRDRCIRTPRTGQIYFLGFRLCCQPAIVEDIAVLFPFIGRRSSDIAIAFAMNVTAIKNSGRPAENKIDCSFNIAIFVILTALLPICVESILEAEETAVLKIDTVGRYKAGNCLSYGCLLYTSQ